MSLLTEKLVKFRDEQAKQQATESYKVLQYRAIEQIAKELPKSLDELGKIKGIGPVKLKKYGTAILEIVNSGQWVVHSGNTHVIPAGEPESRTEESGSRVGARDDGRLFD